VSALSFFVPGTPIAQGSKRHVGNGVMVESAGDRLKDWRNAITNAAWTYRLERVAITGPVAVALTFVVARPKGHYGTGRNADRVKPSAPLYPATKPDIDKTSRAVLDAITASGVWRDDAQVVGLIARKYYVNTLLVYRDTPGVHIRIEELT
jgi:crossover junction endodeoxyribonuclease RusA